MKIYVSDKKVLNIDFSNSLELELMETVNVGLLDNSANYDCYDIVEEIPQGTQVKSLEQHEEEIRKQERQKVIAELEEWVDKRINFAESNKFQILKTAHFYQVKQKLNDMKGER